MKTYLQAGESFEFQNVGTSATLIASGGVVVSNDFVGLSVTEIPVNSSGTIELEGVYSSQSKATGEAWAVGQKLYYDAGNSRFTTTASTHVWAGWAWEAAASAATTGTVKLKG